MRFIALTKSAAIGLCLNAATFTVQADNHSTATTTLATQAPPAGFTLPRTEVFTLRDPSSGRNYQIAVQRPKDSSRLATAPQVYLLDSPYAFPIVTGAIRFPVGSGTMEDALVIGVGFAEGDRGQASRVRDYTPTEDKDWKLATGGAAAHADFIEKTLFPEISRRYLAQATVTDSQVTASTTSQSASAGTPSAPRRIFIGNSLGGLFGGWLIQARPVLFDDYILGSPSVWFDDESLLTTSLVRDTAADQGATNAATDKPTPNRVFIAVGAREFPPQQQHDMVAGARKLKARLEALPGRQIELKYLEIPEADHGMAFPTTAIHGLTWLLGHSNND
ncbi:alpha/beta hydrolase [Shewanella zhangzhouensis]|uniref:alpha/beta hydrolase n=1 Tax=Shewanella zhangzhouensis TaxID=2864213 RepID=UPI001C65B41A|nr:alpha/beta hydrolase [Shewanella zhangzhouensis]QYK04855.1 alpha/beta hydrolase [Shewanella zhangzhouensis]